MKRGFTLIELLVAVLIIGVLTAMALPMYQKSVDKSRYATLMPLAKNIKDAQEAFYLGGGKYSKDLGSLDVRVPGNPSGNTATLSDGTTVEISNTDGTGYVKMGKENLNNYYVMYQDRSSSYPGEIHCEALSDNDRANELCQNLGGTKIDNALTSGYTAYVLVGTGENAGSGNTPETTGKTVVSTGECGDWWGQNGYQIGSSPSTCVRTTYNDGSYSEKGEFGSGDASTIYVFDENGNEVASASNDAYEGSAFSLYYDADDNPAWSAHEGRYAISLKDELNDIDYSIYLDDDLAESNGCKEFAWSPTRVPLTVNGLDGYISTRLYKDGILDQLVGFINGKSVILEYFADTGTWEPVEYSSEAYSYVRSSGNAASAALQQYIQENPSITTSISVSDKYQELKADYCTLDPASSLCQ